MSSTQLQIGIQLHFLNDYLEKLKAVISQEAENIESKFENHEFEEYEDYESAIDYPLFRSEYAARTVMYELNAMVEGVLQDLAEPFWRENQNSKKTKTINDVPFWAIVELVEKHYGIKLNNTDSAAEYELLRKMVNSFKHRKGFKRHEDVSRNTETGGYNFQYKASLDQAEHYLEKIPVFINHLFKIKDARRTNV